MLSDAINLKRRIEVCCFVRNDLSYLVIINSRSLRYGFMCEIILVKTELVRISNDDTYYLVEYINDLIYEKSGMHIFTSAYLNF